MLNTVVLLTYPPSLMGHEFLPTVTHFPFQYSIFRASVRSGYQLPRGPKIMPPKSLDGDSARVPQVSRASDGKGPFND